MSLHVFMHCDTTSAFIGIGKGRPIKLLQKSARYQNMFCRVGETWNVPARLEDGLEQFTCAMYGRGWFESVDAARAAILIKKLETSTEMLISVYIHLVKKHCNSISCCSYISATSTAGDWQTWLDKYSWSTTTSVVLRSTDSNWHSCEGWLVDNWWQNQLIRFWIWRQCHVTWWNWRAMEWKRWRVNIYVCVIIKLEIIFSVLLQ